MTWDDALLDVKRQRMDPEADEAVRHVIEAGEVESVDALLAGLVRDDQLVPERFPPTVRDYLLRTAALPEWADPDLIEQGEAFFGEHGVSVILSLFCAALPASYAAADGVRVLYLTGRLRTSPYRRIVETAQLIVDVMAEGGLSPQGDGVRDAQKVRLMHAGVRRWLLTSPGVWDAAWGAPLNQEDLAGTLMAFTVGVLQGVERLGVTVLPWQEEAYLHAWKVVGALMGLDADLLPADMAAARELTALIERRNFRPSPEGQELTRALVALLEESAPGTVFRGFPPTLIRHLIGDDVGNMLGLAPEDWTAKLLGPIGRLFGDLDATLERSAQLSQVAAVFGQHLIDSVVWIERGGARAPFHIPTGLLDRWAPPGAAPGA